MKMPYMFSTTCAAIAVITSLTFSTTFASPAAKNKPVLDHWTAERMAQATPRDLFIDSRGLGYLRNKDGSLQPYGHTKAPLLRADKVQPAPIRRPFAKPSGGGGDSTPPDITYMDPVDGATIPEAYTLTAHVSDDSGIKSISFVVTYPNGINTSSFTPTETSPGVWESSLSGFTDGDWSWHVVAKDNGDKGGNTATSGEEQFTVVAGSSGGGGGGGGETGADAVANSGWIESGAVQTAVGRIYFEMPTNARLKRWAGYVCSGTVATDGTSGRSVIITASHCVYDDANKAFARNVIFIPNQAEGSSGTDRDCSNDPMGCWTTSFGVVDINWTTRTFPANIRWDYAFYVVDDKDAHSGASATSESLEAAAGALSVSFDQPSFDVGIDASGSDFTYGLGYSYSDDPNFMYCADNLTTKEADNWWIPICGLSGGSSGGPWVQGMNIGTGSGPIISVNSWGYTDGSAGMAGPLLSETTASCLFDEAKKFAFPVNPADGSAGLASPDC